MPLSDSQRRYLRALAHHRKPVVTVGARGIGPGVLRELDLSLARHELVKVRVAGDRDERRARIEELAAATSAEVVQAIGGVAVLYRPAPEPGISLPR